MNSALRTETRSPLRRAVPAILVAFLLDPLPAAAFPRLFAAPVSYDVGLRPSAVLTADFDRDGKLDLAVANYQRDNFFASAVSILRGHGDGTFAPAIESEIRAGVASLEVGHLNGDGIPDLVSTSYFSSQVSVLLGNGDGTFASTAVYNAAVGTAAVAIADLNGDGASDLAVANNGSNSVSILLGNGDGTFAPKTDFPAGVGANWVACGDLNGDGKPDLATANLGPPSYPGGPNGGGASLSVLLGTGDGSFGSTTDYPTGLSPFFVTIADLNRDGRADLATVNQDGSTVSVLLASPAGGFFGKDDHPVGGRPRSLAIADLDGNGSPDLVVANELSNSFTMLRGNGDGSFAPGLESFVGRSPTAVALGDWTGDGKADLAVTAFETAAVLVLDGNGDGTFAVGVAAPVGERPRFVAIADVTADGFDDVAVANELSNSISVLVSNGDGTFLSSTNYRGGPFPFAVAIGDLNGDSNPDMAVANHTFDPGVSFLPGFLQAGFGNTTRVLSGNFAHGIAIADLDQDGRPDVVVANDLLARLSVLPGNGDGTFGTRRQHPTAGVVSVSVGDLNADGIPDLAASGAGVSVLIGLGGGAFAPFAQYGSASTRGLAIGDLNADGKLDLAVAGDWGAGVMLGIGDGTFAARTDYSTGEAAFAVVIGDLDGDGDPDLAAVNPNRNTVSVFLGNGDGTFVGRQDYATGNLPFHLGIGDVDGNGKPDVVTANYFPSTTASVLVNIAPDRPIPIDFDFRPRRVRLRSKDKWVTGELSPPPPYRASQIDVSSIRLNGVVPAFAQRRSIDRHDQELTVKFAWPLVKPTLKPGRRVAVTVTGLIDGKPFLGTDSIRVRGVPRTKLPEGGTLAQGSEIPLSWELDQDAGEVTLLSSLDDGATWKVEAEGLPAVGAYSWKAPVAAEHARLALQITYARDDPADAEDTERIESEAFAIGSTLGVEDEGPTLALRAVNPARSELVVRLRLPDASPASLAAYDLGGRRVASHELTGATRGWSTARLGTLPSGWYVVRLTHGGRTLAARVLVVR